MANHEKHVHLPRYYRETTAIARPNTNWKDRPSNSEATTETKNMTEREEMLHAIAVYHDEKQTGYTLCQCKFCLEYRAPKHPSMKETAMLKVQEIAYHRNGVTGEGFHVVTFKDGKTDLIGIVFDSVNPDDFCATGRVAVLNTILLGQQPYRGDEYAPFLIEAIKQQEARTSEIVTR